jgi:SAM-dependent methyltransferase
VLDPTRRFSNRVADYVKYRPHYPVAVREVLAREHELRPEHVIADVGSGTGILTALFLDGGHTVYGIEPNAEMRAAGDALLAGRRGFHCLAATAEATTLPAGSVDWVTAGQAFHWFDAQAARREFRRILRPGGGVALVWNERRIDDTPFARGYEDLLVRYGTDYAEVSHRGGGGKPLTQADSLAAFFAPQGFRVHAFENVQEFDFEGVRGRLLSASYVPQAGQPGHEPLLAALRDLFDRHAERGRITFAHDTRVYVGRLG